MLLHKIKNTILSHNLINKYDKVILGISGGHDSVTLLDILAHLQKELKFTLILAHVNYGWRGKDSNKDEEYVKILARKYKIRLYIKRLQVTSYKLQENLEATFRKIRYEFFEKICQTEKAQKIAVAHTLDDQVETILMYFFRGVSLAGLSGMSYQNGKIIRPLLGIGRDEITKYLKERKLKWRQDITNEDTTFTRNRIRHKLLPVLEKNYNPSIKETLAFFADLWRKDNQALEEITEKYFAVMIKEGNIKINKNIITLYETREFKSLPEGLQIRFILRAISALTNEAVSLKKLVLWLKSKQKTFVASPHLSFSRFRDKIDITKTN